MTSCCGTCLEKWSWLALAVVNISASKWLSSRKGWGATFANLGSQRGDLQAVNYTGTPGATLEPSCREETVASMARGGSEMSSLLSDVVASLSISGEGMEGFYFSNTSGDYSDERSDQGLALQHNSHPLKDPLKPHSTPN